MKLLLGFFISLSFPWIAGAADLTVPKIQGLSYKKARQLILKAGWHQGPRPEFEMASKSVIKIYPEVVSCAMDRPVCRFAFVGGENECLAVFTEGEEIATFRVYGYANECETLLH